MKNDGIHNLIEIKRHPGTTQSLSICGWKIGIKYEIKMQIKLLIRSVLFTFFFP